MSEKHIIEEKEEHIIWRNLNNYPSSYMQPRNLHKMVSKNQYIAGSVNAGLSSYNT